MKNDPNARITITEIARMAGVTTATVSRALSGKKGVSDTLRNKIKQFAKVNNYRPNLLAQKLVRQRSHLIGFIGADLTNTYYIQAFRHLEAECRARGYNVLLADSERDYAKENINIGYMLQNQVEGIVFYPVSDWMGAQNQPENHYDELIRANCPVVALGDVSEPAFDAIYSEEYTSSQKLARHLLSLGHVRFCLIELDCDSNRPARTRFQALLQEIKSAQGPKKITPSITVVDAACAGWEDTVVRLFNTKTPPTAILSVNPELALKLYRPLLLKGITIPRDVSIAAVGRTPWAGEFIPSLSLSESDEQNIATLALDVLFRRLSNSTSAPIRTEIHQILCIRDSVAPPPA